MVAVMKLASWLLRSAALFLAFPLAASAPSQANPNELQQRVRALEQQVQSLQNQPAAGAPYPAQVPPPVSYYPPPDYYPQQSDYPQADYASMYGYGYPGYGYPRSEEQTSELQSHSFI